MLLSSQPFVQSLRACPKSGLHNPLKNPERYVMLSGTHVTNDIWLLVSLLAKSSWNRDSCKLRKGSVTIAVSYWNLDLACSLKGPAFQEKGYATFYRSQCAWTLVYHVHTILVCLFTSKEESTHCIRCNAHEVFFVMCWNACDVVEVGEKPQFSGVLLVFSCRYILYGEVMAKAAHVLKQPQVLFLICF